MEPMHAGDKEGTMTAPSGGWPGRWCPRSLRPSMLVDRTAGGESRVAARQRQTHPCCDCAVFRGCAACWKQEWGGGFAYKQDGRTAGRVERGR